MKEPIIVPKNSNGLKITKCTHCKDFLLTTGGAHWLSFLTSKEGVQRHMELET